MILFPFTFMLDNEQEENLTYWLFISNDAKQQQIQSISDFLVEVENYHLGLNDQDLVEKQSVLFESKISNDDNSENPYMDSW